MEMSENTDRCSGNVVRCSESTEERSVNKLNDAVREKKLNDEVKEFTFSQNLSLENM